jgi:hypothetical protein
MMTPSEGIENLATTGTFIEKVDRYRQREKTKEHGWCVQMAGCKKTAKAYSGM